MQSNIISSWWSWWWWWWWSRAEEERHILLYNNKIAATKLSKWWQIQYIKQRERERENFLRKSCSSKTWETKHCNTEKTRVGIACLLANHITALYFTTLHSNSFCKNFKTSSTNLRPHTTRNMTKKEDIDRAASTHARTRASPNPNFGVCPNRKGRAGPKLVSYQKKERVNFPGGPLFSFHNWPMGMRLSSTHQWRWGLWGFLFYVTLSATSELFFPTRCPKSPLLKLPS